MTVTIDQEITLQPSRPDSLVGLPDPWPLGVLEERYLARASPVANIFIYRASAADPSPIPIDRLEQALGRLLDYYPHLTGRLHTSHHGAPEIDRLGSGALLITAKCDSPLPVDPIALHVLPQGLWPPFQGDNLEIDPFFRVQHTRFADGGVSLMIEACHDVCDANGLFILVKDLSDLYNGQEISPPHIKAYPVLTPEEAEDARKLTPKYFALSEADAPMDKMLPRSTSGIPVSARYLTMPASSVAAIKAEATPPGGWVSTFTAMASFFYQSIYNARIKCPGITYAPHNVMFPKNCRDKSRNVTLPDHYFPNAILGPFAVLPHDILTGPLNGISPEIYKMSADLTAEDFERTVRWLAAIPADQVKKICTGYDTGNGALRVTPWNKFDMYDSAVFGGNRPVFAGPPIVAKQLADGLVYILPPLGDKKGDTSLMFCVTLPENVWEKMGEDERWNKYTENEVEYIKA